jgi:hypothetical protein
MELNPSWEAANCAATQELHSILWNPKVHYRVHKSLPFVPILSQIDPVHTIPSHLSKIHFIIMLLQSTPVFLLSFLLYFSLKSPPRMLHELSISSSLIILGEEYKLWSCPVSHLRVADCFCKLSGHQASLWGSDDHDGMWCRVVWECCLFGLFFDLADGVARSSETLAKSYQTIRRHIFLLRLRVVILSPSRQFLLQQAWLNHSQATGPYTFFFCWSHLEHRASVNRFLSLQFLNLRQSAGLLGRGISPSQGRYLTQTQNKHKHPCLERVKTFHASDHAAITKQSWHF